MEFGILHLWYPLHVPTTYSTILVGFVKRFGAICGHPWYSPKMWCLWARSTSPRISCLFTTMAVTVENFWQHFWQHFFQLSSQCSALVWILINRVTPACLARSENFNDDFCIGRTRALMTYQTYFKKSWSVLAKREVSAKKYKTNVKDWTCTCGRQTSCPGSSISSHPILV